MLPTLILVGRMENNPNFSLSRRLNISNYILMSFVFEILYYPSVTFHDCALLASVPEESAGLEVGSTGRVSFSAHILSDWHRKVIKGRACRTLS